MSVTVPEGVRPERDTRRFDGTGLSAMYAFWQEHARLGDFSQEIILRDRLVDAL